APVVTAPASVSAAAGTPVTVNVTAADPDGQAITTLTADLSSLPSGSNASFTANPSKTAGTLTWTPAFGDDRDTPYSVAFTATNALTGSATSAITIIANRPPVVSAPSWVQVNENGTLSVD